MSALTAMVPGAAAALSRAARRGVSPGAEAGRRVGAPADHDSPVWMPRRGSPASAPAGDGPRGARGPARIVLLGARVAEVGQQLVAERGGDVPAVSLHDLDAGGQPAAQLLVVAVERAAERGDLPPLAPAAAPGTRRLPDEVEILALELGQERPGRDLPRGLVLVRGPAQAGRRAGAARAAGGIGTGSGPSCA